MESTHDVEVCVRFASPRKELSGQVRQAALAALHHQDAPFDCTLTVVLSHDNHLRQLNRKYAGIDDTTDVLSFPYQDTIDPHYLGDIIISVETAERQASVMGHNLLAELNVLTVHGTLHLLGHGHGNAATKARMWQAQREIIFQLKTKV